MTKIIINTKDMRVTQDGSIVRIEVRNIITKEFTSVIIDEEEFAEIANNINKGAN